jgi:hypothetical protein
MGEAHPVATGLHQPQAHAEGRGEPDVDPTGPTVAFQGAAQGVDQRRVGRLPRLLCRGGGLLRVMFG